jgi:hypothetical protein
VVEGYGSLRAPASKEAGPVIVRGTVAVTVREKLEVAVRLFASVTVTVTE